MSAPMLIRSTPVSARARTEWRLTPPEASSLICGAAASRRRTASATWLGAKVVDQDDIGRALEREIELLEGVDFDLDGRAGGS